MWQVAAVSPSPPQPRLSPPGSSLWRCAGAAMEGESSTLATHTRARAHTRGTGFTRSHLGMELDKDFRRKNECVHIYARAQAHCHSTLVTQCCVELLSHQTQVSDTNYSRGLDEESFTWPWHTHTRMHSHSSRTDKEQVNMMTLLNNSGRKLRAKESKVNRENWFKPIVNKRKWRECITMHAYCASHIPLQIAHLVNELWTVMRMFYSAAAAKG